MNRVNPWLVVLVFFLPILALLSGAVWLIERIAGAVRGWFLWRRLRRLCDQYEE